jgi:hypothetical protein
MILSEFEFLEENNLKPVLCFEILHLLKKKKYEG